MTRARGVAGGRGVAAGRDLWLALTAPFRYLRRVRSSAAATISIGLTLLLGAACRDRAKTPGEAVGKLAEAVAAKDAAQLWAALDLPTRWSWMSVRRAHREAYDIVLSNVPEGPARDEQLQRFEPGALADSDVALFTRELASDKWDELAKALPASPTIEPVGDNEARVAVAGARPLTFRRGDDGSWGYAGFAADAEERKRRAQADLELVRDNAADLERAATRAGR